MPGADTSARLSRQETTPDNENYDDICNNLTVLQLQVDKTKVYTVQVTCVVINTHIMSSLDMKRYLQCTTTDLVRHKKCMMEKVF